MTLGLDKSQIFESPGTRLSIASAAFAVDVTLLILGFITTKTDPSDMTVRIERYFRLTKQVFDDSNYAFYCNHCDANVKEYSKHCGRCQRCTEKFDHHCIWLNNCIGYNNYRPFFCTLVFVILHSLAVIGLGIAHILPITSFQSVFTQIGVLDIISLIMIILNAIAAAFIGYLLLYHIWLFKVGKTTYQHILEIRKK